MSFRDSASLWWKGDYRSFLCLAISHDPFLKLYTNPPKGRLQDLRGKKFSTTSPVRPVVLKLGLQGGIITWGASRTTGAWVHLGDCDLIGLGLIAAFGISKRPSSDSNMQIYFRGHLYLFSQSLLYSWPIFWVHPSWEHQDLECVYVCMSQCLHQAPCILFICSWVLGSWWDWVIFLFLFSASTLMPGSQ